MKICVTFVEFSGINKTEERKAPENEEKNGQSSFSTGTVRADTHCRAVGQENVAFILPDTAK